MYFAPPTPSSKYNQGRPHTHTSTNQIRKQHHQHDLESLSLILAGSTRSTRRTPADKQEANDKLWDRDLTPVISFASRDKSQSPCTAPSAIASLSLRYSFALTPQASLTYPRAPIRGRQSSANGRSRQPEHAKSDLTIQQSYTSVRPTDILHRGNRIGIQQGRYINLFQLEQLAQKGRAEIGWLDHGCDSCR